MLKILEYLQTHRKSPDVARLLEIIEIYNNFHSPKGGSYIHVGYITALLKEKQLSKKKK